MVPLVTECKFLSSPKVTSFEIVQATKICVTRSENALWMP